MDREFESVAASLKQPFHRLFRVVTVPVCLPTILDISIYLFVNAMTTVSAVVFLYAPTTTLASVAVRSEEHTSELQSLMRISYAVFCLNTKTTISSDYILTKHNDTC